jgi:hypothetical protein
VEGGGGVGVEAAHDMKSLAAILVLLVFAGCSTNFRNPEFKPGGLPVRFIYGGDVQYWDGGGWDRLRVNMVLTNGAQIRTGHDAKVGFLAGRSVIMLLSSDSKLDLAATTVRHLLHWDETRTVLELRQGTIQCIVKKLSPESSFQIRGGDVTVDVRKGDFQMSADGRVEAVAGELTVLAAAKTCLLRAGDYFDSRKGEVGKVPDLSAFLSTFITNPVTDYYIVDFVESRPPSLSFDRGLENARRGWVDPAAGN